MLRIDFNFNMPRPVYIIVAKEAIEDKATNFLSLISVVEVFNVAIFPNPQDLDPQFSDALRDARRLANRFHAMAVWMREAGDEEVVFEHQFVMALPQREDLLPAAPFQFNAEFPLQRFRLQIQGVPLLEESCTIHIESRVRRHDTGEEWRQRYPIVCNVERQLPVQAAPQHENGDAI